MSEVEQRHADLLQDRYGSQAKPGNVLWNPIIEAQAGHRSVRTFLHEPLPDGTLETMVLAAQSASTSSALHQWSLVVVADETVKQRVHDVVAAAVPTDRIPWIEEAPAVLLWIADSSRSAAVARERGAEPVVLDYLDSFLMAATDTALAAQNAALAAESIGLGVVFLGVMRNAAGELAEILSLPPYSYVSFGMAVGKPSLEKTYAARPRMAQGVVLHHDRYDASRFKNLIEGYEAAYQTFREEQNMKPQGWRDAAHFAATDKQYLGAREKLRDTVTEQGFGLR